jgi:iron-sulfur cluster assembly protein
MITISEAASKKVLNMLEDVEVADMFLRVGVIEGGCTGYSYALGLDDERSDDDEVMQMGELTVVVDKTSMPLINGLKIDFKDSAMGGGFTMFNPNATATCGCGASFRTAGQAGKPSAAGHC